MKDWNRSLKVGDYVFSKYRKDNFLYRVIEIHKQYIDANDIKYYPGIYGAHNIGDEKPPIVTIQRAFDLSVDYNSNKKKFKKSTLNIFYIMPFEEKMLIDHIKRLSDALYIIRNSP